MPKAPEKSGSGIDPAALAAAALAAAISSVAPPGPFGPISMVVGGTILLLIFAYDIDPHRSHFQSLAFCAVAALIAVLALGYPMECIFAHDRIARLQIILKEVKEDPDNPSEVPPIAEIIVWTTLTMAFFWRDGKNRRRAPN